MGIAEGQAIKWQAMLEIKRVHVRADTSPVSVESVSFPHNIRKGHLVVMQSLLWHVFLGPQVRTANICGFVGTVVFSRQFGIVQATSIAQGPRSIRSSSPFGSLSPVAAVTASGRCCSAPTFLGVYTCKSARLVLLHIVLVRIRLWLGRLAEHFVLMALIRGLLLVRRLLCQNDLSNLHQRIKLHT